MPKKVLYTINNLNTAGMKLVVADLVRRLDRSRFIPMVAVNRKTGSPLERDLEEICEVVEVPLRIPRRPRFAFPINVWRAIRQLRGIADIAHSFDYSSDWTEGLAMRLAGIPWVMVKTNLFWDERRWFLKCALAHKIVCLSQAQVQVMRRWSHKITVIPTGVDIEKFQNAAPVRREQFGLSDRDVVLVSVAHLVPVKGHPDLIRAIAIVKDELPNLKLLLIGDGEPDYVQELKNLVRNLGLRERVIFGGKSDCVPSILKMCDGKVLATRNEGRREAFGAALVEAMAAGLPVIATRSGGPEEIVVDGETGWLVDAGKPEALAEAIRDFYNNPEKRKRFGQAGFQRAQKFYNVNLMVQRYESLYAEVLGLKGNL